MGKLIWGIMVFFGLSVENIESRKPKSSPDCLNPRTSKTCSGSGYCQKSWGGPDFCVCHQVDFNGQIYTWNTAKFFGNWCQCNPWDCHLGGIGPPWKKPPRNKVDYYSRPESNWYS